MTVLAHQPDTNQDRMAYLVRLTAQSRIVADMFRLQTDLGQLNEDRSLG